MISIIFFNDCKVFAYTNEPVHERLQRNIRMHKGTWLLSVLTILLCALLTTVLIRTSQQEATDWQLVIHEDFDNISLEDITANWTLHSWPSWFPPSEQQVDLEESGIIQLLDGALFVNTSNRKSAPYNLTINRRLPGDLRVRWECTPLKDHVNLNCFIGGADRWNSYMFHLAANGDDLFCQITRKMETLVTRQLPAAFQVGKTYIFQMEKEGKHIRIYINDELFMEVEDIIPLSGSSHQQFGFEQTVNRLRIDNLKVWVQPLPERIEHIEVAHALADNGNPAAAIVYYENLIEAAPESEAAARARYHSALCLQQLDRHQQAIEQLQHFSQQYPNHPLYLHALGALASSWLALDNMEQVEQQSSRIAAGKDVPVQLKLYCLRLIAAHYSGGSLNNLSRQADGLERARHLLQQVASWEQKLQFSSENISQIRTCLACLHTLGYYQEILDNYPQYENACGLALIAVHKPEEALQRYGHISSVKLRALIALGRYDEYLQKASSHNPGYVSSLLALSRYSAIRRLSSYNNLREAEIHVASGNYKKALQYDPENTSALQALNLLDRIPDRHESVEHNADYEEVMMRRGQTQEMLARNRSNTHSFFDGCLLHSINLIKAGTPEAIKPWLERIRSQPYDVNGRNLTRHVIPCMLEFFISGDTFVIDNAAVHIQNTETLKYIPADSMFDFIRNGGKYEPYHTSIPEPREQQWQESLLQAFHYEYAGDLAAAKKQYKETLRLLPPHEAIVYTKLAEWRIDTLK